MKVRPRFILIVFALVGGAVLAWPELNYYLVNGHIRRTNIEEKLASPIKVTGWTEDGLHLADGRTVQLLGFKKLPVSSTALTEVSKHGVEIGADGKVHGLMLIHHWCGNDPVRQHLARVDIASMLKFLQEGEWTGPIDEEAASFQCKTKGGSFTKWGWNISEHYCFLSWDSYAALQEAKRARKSE